MFFFFFQVFETHLCLMVVEAIIMITIMSLCIRRISNVKQSSPEIRAPILSPSRLSKRRNSADSCSPPIARKVKKRSNSEENLSAGIYKHYDFLFQLLIYDLLGFSKYDKKRKKY